MTTLLAPDEKDVRKVATAVNQALKGKLNSFGTVTLTHDATSTTVNNAFVGPASVVLLTPQTANAAAALSTTYVQPADIVSGVSFKLTHANDSNADKTFGYCIIGG